MTFDHAQGLAMPETTDDSYAWTVPIRAESGRVFTPTFASKTEALDFQDWLVVMIPSALGTPRVGTVDDL